MTARKVLKPFIKEKVTNNNKLITINDCIVELFKEYSVEIGTFDVNKLNEDFSKFATDRWNYQIGNKFSKHPNPQWGEDGRRIPLDEYPECPDIPDIKLANPDSNYIMDQVFICDLLPNVTNISILYMLLQIMVKRLELYKEAKPNSEQLISIKKQYAFNLSNESPECVKYTGERGGRYYVYSGKHHSGTVYNENSFGHYYGKDTVYDRDHAIKIVDYLTDEQIASLDQEDSADAPWRSKQFIGLPDKMVDILKPLFNQFNIPYDSLNNVRISSFVRLMIGRNPWDCYRDNSLNDYYHYNTENRVKYDEPIIDRQSDEYIHIHQTRLVEMDFLERLYILEIGDRDTSGTLIHPLIFNQIVA